MIGGAAAPTAALSRRRWLRWAAVALTLLSFAAALPALARWLRYTRLALAYDLPLDSQEGFALWEADLWRAGQGLYVPPGVHSFVSAPYPPLHPLLIRLIGSGSGPHVFWGGRVLSLAALVLLALVAVWLVRRVSDSWLGGLVAAALILAQPPFQLWAMRIKPDLLGLLLTVLGFAGLAALHPRPGATDAPRPALTWWQALLLAAPFTLAHFTKQTLVAGPLAACTWLWLVDRRGALRLAAALVAQVGALWLAFDLHTGGEYTHHIWVLHSLGWKIDLWRKLVAVQGALWPLALLALLGLVACRRRPTAINAYALWAPLSLLGAGVQGAHHNHLLESGLALALAGGQVVGLALGGLDAQRRRWLLAAVPAVALQWWLLAVPQPWFGGDFTPSRTPERFVHFIENTPGEILSDDVGLLYRAGRPLIYDDFSTMGPAATRGLWDQSGLIADIQRQRFSAILLPVNTDTDGREDPAGHWTPAVLDAIATYYQVKFVDTQVIYAPKPPAP